MKKSTLALITILIFALTACSNPISSEFDNGQDNTNEHTPLYSGHSQNG